MCACTLFLDLSLLTSLSKSNNHNSTQAVQPPCGKANDCQTPNDCNQPYKKDAQCFSKQMTLDLEDQLVVPLPMPFYLGLSHANCQLSVQLDVPLPMPFCLCLSHDSCQLPVQLDAPCPNHPSCPSPSSSSTSWWCWLWSLT